MNTKGLRRSVFRRIKSGFRILSCIICKYDYLVAFEIQRRPHAIFFIHNIKIIFFPILKSDCNQDFLFDTCISTCILIFYENVYSCKSSVFPVFVHFEIQFECTSVPTRFFFCNYQIILERFDCN